MNRFSDTAGIRSEALSRRSRSPTAWATRRSSLLIYARRQWKGLIGVTFSVRNVGSRPGKAVPQLYITFPAEAGEPPAQLKAFQVVRIEPGQVSPVGMEIPIDDLAIYDDDSRSRVVPGMYEIQLGVSSVDLRLKVDVQVP